MPYEPTTHLVLNTDFLRDVTCDDYIFQKELFVLFKESFLEDNKIEKLKNAITSKDTSVIYEHAHYFKGMCYQLGIDKLGHTFEFMCINSSNLNPNIISILNEDIQNIFDVIKLEYHI